MDIDTGTFDLTGSGANTKIRYMYRDAANYKVGHEIVLAGRLTHEQAERIVGSLDGREFFIPSQVGLRDIQGDFESGKSWDDEDDHVWHTIEGVELVDEPVTASGHDARSVAEMMESWPEDARGWDVAERLASLQASGMGY